MIYLKVLDEGFVKFIEAWGTGEEGVRDFRTSEIADYEQGIIEAARQSTQGNFRGWEQDRKLLAHLYNNNHSTPFEFAGMVLEVKAPIMVFREWHRHRTFFYNEMSARYAPLPFTDYLPNIDRLMNVSTTNKQAMGTGATLDRVNALSWLTLLETHYLNAESVYQQGLNWGVPKEIARLVLTFGRYSKMRAGGNLRNWLAFLTLRLDPMAQQEIRAYADAVAQIIAVKFPETFELFNTQREKK